MANTRSAAKQARANVRRRLINSSILSKMKNAEKKVRSLVQEGKKEEAIKFFPVFQSQLDRAAKKRVIHSNQASRRKSRVSALLGAKTAKA